MQPVYAEFDEAEYSKLRRSLINRTAGGSAVRREFLIAVRNSCDFLEFIERKVGVRDGKELDPLADRMSEAEFGNPPSDTESRLFEAWSELVPRIACRTAFWARVTYRHVLEQKIESSFLAANGGGTISGAQRIDAALSQTGERMNSDIDSCIRTVLRRLGGLPEARGNRSVYVNCPLARAWWRERLVAEVADGYGEDVKRDIRAVLHPESQQYWEELVTFVVSRNSVFGSMEVRGMLIKVLSESTLRNAGQLKRVCRAISSLQASIELSVLPPEEVRRQMTRIVHSVEP